MELIPILSLIILVATISTFILAIGAYVLYKIRENKGLEESEAEILVPAEFVTPESDQQSEQEKLLQKKYYDGGTLRRDPLFVSRSDSRIKKSTTQQRFSTMNEMDLNNQEKTTNKELNKKRFLRYTQDGYEDPENNSSDDEDTLRWR